MLVDVVEFGDDLLRKALVVFDKLFCLFPGQFTKKLLTLNEWIHFHLFLHLTLFHSQIFLLNRLVLILLHLF
jgi:hypothetical protein